MYWKLGKWQIPIGEHIWKIFIKWLHLQKCSKSVFIWYSWARIAKAMDMGPGNHSNHWKLSRLWHNLLTRGAAVYIASLANPMRRRVPNCWQCTLLPNFLWISLRIRAVISTNEKCRSEVTHAEFLSTGAIAGVYTPTLINKYLIMTYMFMLRITLRSAKD